LAVCAVANGRHFRDRLRPRTSRSRSDSVHQFSCRFPRIPQIGMDDSCSPTGLIVLRPIRQGPHAYERE
jgi:hypothetical protein